MRLAGLLLLIACAVPAQRLDRWQIVGPGGGGAMFYPAVSPHDTRRVLVACDMTGSYITDDGGESWRMFNLRAPTKFFVFDPKDPDTIYAGGIGLWRSRDGGKGWELVYPSPEGARIRIAGDHGEVAIVSNGQSAANVAAFAVDPADSNVLYTARSNALYISDDAGATWTRLNALNIGVKKIIIDPRSDPADRTLYIVSDSAIQVRQAGTWRNGIALPDGGSIVDVSAGLDKSGMTIYAISQTGVFVSEDGAASWRECALPGTKTRYAAVATSLQHPDVVYVSYSNLTLSDGYWFGVACSEDRGRTWDLLWKEANRPAANIGDAWLSSVFGPGWAGSPLSLGVAPGDPQVCYGTDYGRTMRTTDGGKTWSAVYSRKVPDAAFASTGLDVTTNYGVHFDPFDPNRMFISYTDIGLFRSEDGGQTWMSSITGVPSAWRNTTYWVAFDPDIRGRMWGVMSRTHDLPRPKMWRTAGTSAYQGGVCVSDDGGRTWRQSNRGMADTAPTHILLDPNSPADARVLYVPAVGKGVYKSVDGGANWTLKNSGIPGADPLAWRLAFGGDGALYLVVARRSENGTYGNDNDGALYRSTDGAETWTKIPLPAGVNGPNGLAVDPADPNRLYLAAWGRYSSSDDEDGGIFLTTDGGATWTNVLSADQHIYDVTIDSRDRSVLYASGFESSAWRSEDAGLTWTRIRGYNFKWGHRVIPDPADPDKVYVTTFGGSVWHGPALGDPDAPEDITTPSVAYNR